MRLGLRCEGGQGAGDFGEDFGLDGGADNLGDEIEHLADRGDAFSGGEDWLRGLPFGGKVAAGAEFAERNVHFPVQAIHRFLTFFWFVSCGPVPRKYYRQSGGKNPNKNRTKIKENNVVFLSDAVQAN